MCLFFNASPQALVYILDMPMLETLHSGMNPSSPMGLFKGTNHLILVALNVVELNQLKCFSELSDNLPIHILFSHGRTNWQ